MSTITKEKKRSVLVLGAGSFGTCLGNHLAHQNHQVTIWARNTEVAEKINSTHTNIRYFPSLKLHPELKATQVFDADVAARHDAILIAVPTQAIRQTLVLFKDLIKPSHLLICAAKGIEIGTLNLPSEIIKDTLGRGFSNEAAYLSGPSFAAEIIQQLPTAVCIASSTEKSATAAQNLFHSNMFRTYICHDPIGLEVAGALKNTIAIASGICAGLKFGKNAQASLITRGLTEIVKIGMHLDADPMTFMGLSGVGDLFLTCSSEQSRNYKVGLRLGQGEKIQDILNSMPSVAEGYTTTKAAYQILQKNKLTAPMIQEMYHVLYEDKPIRKAVEDLLSRDVREEFTTLLKS